MSGDDWREHWWAQLMLYALEVLPPAEAAAMRLGAPQQVRVELQQRGHDVCVFLRQPDGTWAPLGAIWTDSLVLDACKLLGWQVELTTRGGDGCASG